MSGPGGGASPTWTVVVPDGASPADVLVATAPLRLTPAPPHSTSWRFVDGDVVLSFVAVAAEPPPSALVPIAPPAPSRRPGGAIGHDEVLAHAARHVAFLLATDPAELGIADAGWLRAAGEHVPTVFRELVRTDRSC